MAGSVWWRTQKLMFDIPKCLTHIYKYTVMCQSNTTKLYYVYYCIRATCFDSYRIIFRPFYDTDPYLAMFKMRCGIPNAYILDIAVYKMYVSLCSYCTIRILISKTLTGTYKGSYTSQIHSVTSFICTG